MTKKRSLLDAMNEREQEQTIENELPTEQTSDQIPNRSRGRGPVEGFLDIQEAKLRLGVSDRTLAEYLREGKIKAQKFGGKWRIRPEAIDAFMNGEG